MKEKRLAYVKANEFTPIELLKFAFSRKSFFRDYDLLRRRTEDEVRHRLAVVLGCIDLAELADEVRLCFQAGVTSDSRHTYYFNMFLIELIEMHYSNFLFQLKSREIKEEHHLVYDEPLYISYEWALCSEMLNPYQRYLLFEYLTLGYTLEDLARRRYCTKRTIYNHLQTIAEVLGS